MGLHCLIKHKLEEKMKFIPNFGDRFLKSHWYERVGIALSILLGLGIMFLFFLAFNAEIVSRGGHPTGINQWILSFFR
jgi:hypothetical protein